MSPAAIDTTRAARVKRIFDHAGDADVLLATTPANVAYLLGRELASDAVYGTTMGGTWLAASRSGEVLVIAASIDLPVILDGTANDQVVAHDGYLFPEAPPGHPLSEVERLTRDRALSRFLPSDGTLLIDARGSVVDAVVTAAAGPGRVRQDARPFIATRSRKEPGELDRLRRVNQIAEAALVDALRAARPGQTEGELTGAIHAGMLARGAQPRLCIVGFGERGAIPQDYPSARPLRLGDTIRCDVNCTLDGYNADLARTAVLGNPRSDAADAYAALLAAADAAAAALRPGIEAGALWRRTIDEARRAGLDSYERHHCGHGIGLEVYEPPVLARAARDALTADMVVCVETLWLVPGAMGLQIEDAYVVTPSGPERLASGSRALIDLDP